MAVVDKETLMARLKEIIGEDDSDDKISFIEDASDTFDDLVSKTTDKENWKAKYEENDAKWKKKYKERFFSSGEEVKEEQEDDVKDDSEKKTFSELFTDKEG